MTSIDPIARALASRVKRAGIVDIRDFGPLGTGNDDTTPLQAAITQALAANFQKIQLEGKTYNTTAHLDIPVYTGSPWKLLEIAGAGHPPMTFGTTGVFTVSPAGTIIKCSATSGDSILGVGTATLSNYLLYIHDLTLRTYDNPQIHALNSGYINQLVAERVMIDTNIYDVASTQPSHGTFGLITPRRFNSANTYLRNVSISGYSVGMEVNEHTNGDNIQITGAVNAMNFMGADHASYFGRVGVFACNHGINVLGACGFNISQYDDEQDASGKWYTYVNSLNDPSNLALGNVNYWTVVPGTGATDHFIKNGGTGVVCKRLGT